MPRHSEPLAPEAGPLAVFALELRVLRDQQGPTAPTVAEISNSQKIPRSTLYAALGGNRIPSVKVLAALVTAWGGNPNEWTLKRARLVAAVNVKKREDSALLSPPMLREWPEHRSWLLDMAARNTKERERRERDPQYRKIALLIELFTVDIAILRMEAGLSLEDLADRISGQGRSVSLPLLSAAESGHHLPNWSLIEHILRALLPRKELQTHVRKWKGRWNQLNSLARTHA